MKKLAFAAALTVGGCGTTVGERGGSGALAGHPYDQHRKGNID